MKPANASESFRARTGLSHQGSLWVSTVLIGASIVAVSRGRCRRVGVPWGSQVFSGMAGAHFIRLVGVPAVWSISGGKRTRRGHPNL
jgi:hypothetical protein